MAQTLRPDVIVMDIAMPVLNGLEATRQILAANPAAKVVMLSAHSDDVYVERMNEAGVAGFLEKQTSAEILTKAIHEVAAGNTFFSPSIAKRLRDNQSKPRDRDGLLKANGARLTSRESEVLQLVAEGAANKQVAAELGISIKTVEKHRQHLMDKLNIHDTAGLTRYAHRRGHHRKQRPGDDRLGLVAGAVRGAMDRGQAGMGAPPTQELSSAGRLGLPQVEWAATEPGSGAHRSG